MHLVHSNKSDNNMPALKIIAWFLYDINMLGVWAYTLASTFSDSANVVEKALLCLASLIFFAFRIRSLHLDNQKKEIDNEERRQQIREKKAELDERERMGRNFKRKN